MFVTQCVSHNVYVTLCNNDKHTFRDDKRTFLDDQNQRERERGRESRVKRKAANPVFRCGTEIGKLQRQCIAVSLSHSCFVLAKRDGENAIVF